MLAPDVDRLAAAYRGCRAIAKAHSKTFYLSSLFLEAQKRRAVWAVYAFCRAADDIVDRPAPVDERRAAIDAWERELVASYEGTGADPVLIAFADAARRFAIPIEPGLALLQGARMDLAVHRYPTYDDLREYCYLVASTVGLLVMPILGVVSPQAEIYGVTLGRAMQMTNILRDVGEDARMGRIYLPLEDLHRFDCSEDSIIKGTVSAAFVELMRFEIARVRQLYADAEPGIAMLAPDARYTVRLALTLYREILDRIEANAFDVFGRRAHVPFRAKLVGALTAALTR